jgi:hypothetical protein
MDDGSVILSHTDQYGQTLDASIIAGISKTVSIVKTTLTITITGIATCFRINIMAC